MCKNYYELLPQRHLRGEDMQAMDHQHSVVVLDDCEIDQFFARRAIDETPWFDEVEQFVDPREALAFFVSKRLNGSDKSVDLLLLDFRMPHMNGVQFLEQIKSCNLGQLINSVAVMMTVPLLQCDAQAFKKLHPDLHFVAKPLERHAIGSAIGVH
jgi:CheY-like chemotaxis protein